MELNEIIMSSIDEFNNDELREYIISLSVNLEYLLRENAKLEKALDNACGEWSKEALDCHFLLIKHHICDEKCGKCDIEKRKNYRKQWCLKEDE